MAEVPRGSLSNAEASFLRGGGEAGALARAVDWAQTPVGPIETWSQAFRSAVALVLHQRSQMLLWWGPEFVQIYNDGYTPVLGDKHPRAMGQRFRDCWVEVFHIVGPLAEVPYRGGPPSTDDDIALPLNRRFPTEEAHFAISYCPVPDETVQPTGIGGVLATVTEITQQVYAQRQLRTLRELGASGAARARTAEDECVIAAATLAGNAWDLPFALFYLVDDDGRRARLVADVGFGPATVHAVAPAVVELSADDPAGWPLARVASERQVVIVDDLARWQPDLPASPWAEKPRRAILMPLASPDQPHAYGVLICGVSPHRVLDADYRSFFELVSAQIVTSIRNARAYQAERERAERLEEIDRAKTAFFSNVSHEFRTPLTLMLGPTEDALRAGRALGGDELELVHRNELRLLKLVNALLEFSRMEAGRASASYEPTDLATLTADVASAFRSAIERAGLAFQVTCEPLPEPIQVDRVMWEKVVLNLLSNALKFTFEGAIALELRAAGEGATLTVRDTGTGIPADELPHMFERFHRIEVGSPGTELEFAL